MPKRELDDFERKQLPEILKYYRKGKALGYIAEQLELPVTYILELLFLFTQESRINKKLFSKEFKMVVAERYQNDVDREVISKELGISNSLISSANSQYEFQVKKSKFKRNYQLVSTNKSLKTCPFCRSERVNKLKSIIEVQTLDGSVNYKTTRGIFCLKCKNEFFYFKKSETKDIYVVVDDEA